MDKLSYHPPYTLKTDLPYLQEHSEVRGFYFHKNPLEFHKAITKTDKEKVDQLGFSPETRCYYKLGEPDQPQLIVLGNNPGFVYLERRHINRLRNYRAEEQLIYPWREYLARYQSVLVSTGHPSLTNLQAVNFSTPWATRPSTPLQEQTQQQTLDPETQRLIDDLVTHSETEEADTTIVLTHIPVVVTTPVQQTNLPDDNSDSESDMGKDEIPSKPISFTGERIQTENFLFQVDLMFKAKPKTYDTELKKIAGVLGLMTTGTAADWARAWHKDHYKIASDSYDKTWLDLRAEIEDRFKPFIQKEKAISQIARIRCPQVNGIDNIDKYVETFNYLKDKAEFKDDGSNIVFFKQGLPKWCVSKIMDLDDQMRPKTLASWQEKAIRYGAEQAGRSYHGSLRAEYMGEPMEVDVAKFKGPISEEERRKQ